jgi:hypothetical protein
MKEIIPFDSMDITNPFSLFAIEKAFIAVDPITKPVVLLQFATKHRKLSS